MKKGYENLNNYINNMLEQTSGMNAYEAEEYVVRGMSGIAPDIDTNAVRFATKQAMANRPGGHQSISSANAVSKFAAEFQININRATANIAKDLVVPLFGVLESESGFQEILAAENPNIATSIVVKWGHRDAATDSRNCEITFTDGGDIDIVHISCKDYPYVGLVKTLTSGRFNLSNIQYEISDKTKVAQFKKKFTVKSRSVFGKLVENPVPVYKHYNQNQDGIVLLNSDIDIYKEDTILLGIDDVAAFDVTLGFFLQHFQR